jgi:hypothetical protein
MDFMGILKGLTNYKKLHEGAESTTLKEKFD